MARCNWDDCLRWRPDVLVNRGTGYQLDGEWYCSPGCLQEAASQQLSDQRLAPEWPTTGPRIGSLLVQQQALSAASLRLALKSQAVTRLPLGRQLEQMGLVSRATVLRALSTQAGVSYLAAIDLSQVRRVTEPLTTATLRELGLVAVDVSADEQRLKVACVAPVRWPVLRAINRVTGWTAEPLLVSDSDWQKLMTALAEKGQSQAIPVTDVEDAAALTTKLALEKRAHEVTMARVDPFILVRMENRSRHEDLLMHLDVDTSDALSKEEPCLAVSM